MMAADLGLARQNPVTPYRGGSHTGGVGCGFLDLDTPGEVAFAALQIACDQGTYKATWECTYGLDRPWERSYTYCGGWTADEHADEHGRGLAIVAAIAGDENWGIHGDAASRTTWFRLKWHQNPEERPPFV